MPPQYFLVCSAAPRSRACSDLSARIIGFTGNLVNFKYSKRMDLAEHATFGGPPGSPEPALAIRTISSCSEESVSGIRQQWSNTRHNLETAFQPSTPVQRSLTPVLRSQTPVLRSQTPVFRSPTPVLRWRKHKLGTHPTSLSTTLFVLIFFCHPFQFLSSCMFAVCPSFSLIASCSLFRT